MSKKTQYTVPTKATANNQHPGPNKKNSNTNNVKTQLKPITFTTKLPIQLSPQTDNENFENINEFDLPIVGELASNSTT